MITNIADIDLPVRDVTLAKLKAKGQPVVVRCELVAEDAIARATEALELAEAFGGLPGPRPDAPAGKRAKKDDTKSVLDMLEKAGPVIEIGTSLMRAGLRVHPAFCFCGKHPDAIPGRYLQVVDKQALFMAVMEVSGYLGGVADAAKFPDDANGSAAGAGAVDAGQGNGDSALPAAAEPASAGL